MSPGGLRPGGPEDDGLPRAALRLTTGVTVLTACHDGRVHGATVSAAGVVSRSPLTIGAGLRQSSELLELALASGLFAVNVLSGRQAQVADWFASPRRPRGRAQFDVLEWDPDPATGLPLLRHTLARLVCRVTGQVAVGDHELLLAEVVDGASGAGSPLLSFDGDLHSAEFRDVVRRRWGRSLAATATVSLD
ncbi:flavin reductase family protein [Streptomyces sp. NPDC002908]|uniref:flavin reductase family protein n=1 Tax=Streptomyces sp. NPDC002908 TaxID=3364670 RepID=UPI0036909168